MIFQHCEFLAYGDHYKGLSTLFTFMLLALWSTSDIFAVVGLLKDGLHVSVDAAPSLWSSIVLM